MIWGSNDCYTFVRDWIRAKYNKPEFGIKQDYSDFRQALKINKELKWNDLLREHFNIKSVYFPKDGDIVIFNVGVESANIFYHDHLWSIDKILYKTEYKAVKPIPHKIYRICQPLDPF